MSRVRPSTVLAWCALTGSAAVSTAVLAPPVQDANYAAGGGASASEIHASSTAPNRVTAPSINDPAFIASLGSRDQRTSLMDWGHIPTGVDAGVNDPDLIGALPDAPEEQGNPDNCVCIDSYYPGDQVVAAVNNPQGNTQIFAGDVGTVICGRFFNGGEQDLLLVEWNINNGHDGLSSCDCPVGGNATAPLGWYVFCSEVYPYENCTCSETYVPGDTVYATVEAPDGNGQIRRGDSGTVVGGAFAGGGEYDVVLVEWNINNGHNGGGACDCPPDAAAAPGTGWFVFCNQITNVPPIDCVCPEHVFFPGETMYSTVNNPDGNQQIVAGDAATVICGNASTDAILGQWNITNGHQNVAACQCPVGPPPPPANTGWFLHCNELHPLNPPILCGACAGDFGVGDVVWARKNAPSGKADIQRGWRGTVVGSTTFNPPLLIEWDNLTTGHDGNGVCDCPNGASSAPGQGWYVDCSEVSLAPIPCEGDTNHDDVIDVVDLLNVLGDWGPCAGCLSDMNGDDDVNVTDLLALLGAWGQCSN